MKAASKFSRKRRLQTTSLLRMRKCYQQNIAAENVKEKQNEQNANNFCGNVYDQQLMRLKSNSFTAQKSERQFCQPKKLYQVQRNNFDPAEAYYNPCACYTCTRNLLNASRQSQQQQNEHHIGNTNKGQIYEQQRQAMWSSKHTDGLSAWQNKHSNHHLIIPQAGGYFPAEPVTKATQISSRVASNNSFNQQNVKFQPRFGSFNFVDGQTQLASISQHYKLNHAEKNTDSRYRCFPSKANFEESLGSLTSSVDSFESDASEVVTSWNFVRPFITSQQTQMINNAGYCNFVCQ